MWNVDVTEIAKEIRAQLKSDFPGTTFSVRISRYLGGSTINVHWVDGPTAESVEKVANPFAEHALTMYLSTWRSLSVEFREELAELVLAESGEQDDLALAVFLRSLTVSR